MAGKAPPRKRGKRPAPTKRRTSTSTEVASPTDDARVIDGASSVLAIQFEAPADRDICSVTLEALFSALRRLETAAKGDGWEFFIGLERFHATQMSTWIGIGAGVPPRFADLVQQRLQELGLAVGREHAVIAHHELCPLLAVTHEGIELPASASMIEADDLRPFGVQRIRRRPFRINLVEAFKRDLMAKLMLGSDESAGQNFRFRYFEAQGAPVFSFGRVSLEMFGQPGGSYVAMTRLSSTPPCVLSFEFGPAELEQLLSRLAPPVRDEVEEKLSAGTPAFRVPPGSAVVSIRCKRGIPEPDGVPFVVAEFLPVNTPSLDVEF